MRARLAAIICLLVTSRIARSNPLPQENDRQNANDTSSVPRHSRQTNMGGKGCVFNNPYYVSMRSPINLQYCAGSLISSTHILTAARCVDRERMKDPVFGLVDLSTYAIGRRSFVFPPKYPPGFGIDIGKVYPPGQFQIQWQSEGGQTQIQGQGGGQQAQGQQQGQDQMQVQQQGEQGQGQAQGQGDGQTQVQQQGEQGQGQAQGQGDGQTQVQQQGEEGQGQAQGQGDGQTQVQQQGEEGQGQAQGQGDGQTQIQQQGEEGQGQAQGQGDGQVQAQQQGEQGQGQAQGQGDGQTQIQQQGEEGQGQAQGQGDGQVQSQQQAEDQGQVQMQEMDGQGQGQAQGVQDPLQPNPVPPPDGVQPLPVPPPAGVQPYPPIAPPAPIQPHPPMGPDEEMEIPMSPEDYEWYCYWTMMNTCYPHPDFKPDTGINDVGICQMDRALKKGPVLQLPSKPFKGHLFHMPGIRVTKVTPCKSARLVSWFGSDQCKKIGYDESDACRERFKARIFEDSILCTSQVGENVCFHESGAPMVCDNVLYGVVSLGEDCGKKTPGVFTRVDRHLSFIKGNMKRRVSRSTGMLHGAALLVTLAMCCIIIVINL